MDESQINNVVNNDICKPIMGMEFESEQAAFDFYNAYGGKNGFSIRRDHANKSKSGEITSRNFVCSKEGRRGNDKRDYLVKNPRAETRTGCGATMFIKLNRQTRKYFVNAFVEEHNHPLVAGACSHMLPSQRKVSASHSIEIDLANDSGIALRSSYELMSREAGGRESLGFLKADQKNYLRTKRERMLAFGEAGSILKYFQDQILLNPSFFHAVQLDNEEQIMPPTPTLEGVSNPMSWIWNEGGPQYTNFQALLHSGLSYDTFQGSQICSNSTNWSQIGGGSHTPSNEEHNGG